MTDAKTLLKRRLSKFQPTVDKQAGFLGRGDGEIRVPGKAHYVYVRLWNGEVVEAFNRSVPVGFGMAVWVTWKDRIAYVEVRQAYPEIVPDFIPDGLETELQWPNSHALYVRPEQFLAGLVYPTTGLKVKFYGATVRIPGAGVIKFPGEEIDLTGYLPLTGATWAVIYLKADGTIDVETGGAATTWMELQTADIPDVIGLPVFAIRLFAGQTSIQHGKFGSMLEDLRFLQKSGVSWGEIAGTLSDQADLQAALDGKAPVEIVESGFPSRTTTLYEFNTSAPRLFRLYSAGGFYDVWINHTKRSIELTKDITISDVTGLHWIYFDDDEELHEQVGFTTELILDKTLVYVISWNATDSASLVEGDERHGLMQAVVHSYIHRVLHAQWISGGAITATADGSGDLAAHAQIAVSNGRFLDEDIDHIIDETNQNLSPIAQMPIYYRSGASDWKKIAATDYIVTTTGSGRAAYNQLSGGSWGLTEVTNNNYLLMHVFWSNDYRHNTILIMGQNEYATVAAARVGANTELTSLALGGLDDLMPEWVPLGTLIIQTSTGYANAVKSRVRTTDDGGTYIDWRETEFAGGSGGGIDDAPSDSVPYVRKNAAWTGMGQAINQATSKATPVDADELGLWDSVASAFKKLTWANLKGTLKTYFDSLYALIGHNHTGTYEPANANIQAHISSTANPHSTTAAQVAAIPNDGWVVGANTWSYSSADAPTFVISINADMTAILQPGDRIKLTQTTVKYFIVTVVGAYSGGATLVTVYGGTDYTLANAAISSAYYSPVKAPFGFPLAPDKWTVVTSDTGNRAQASPSASTWYNLGSVSITIPIGVWDIYFQTINEVTVTLASALAIAMRCTLSTANNSESDNTMTSSQGATVPAVTGGILRFNQVVTKKTLTLAAKTVYYLNSFYGSSGGTSLNFRGDLAPTVIKAVCVYL